MAKTKDNSVVESITIDEDEDNDKPEVNTLQDTIKQLSTELFVKNPKKTSNLSYDNINGIIRAMSINDYMEASYGYRFNALDAVVREKLALVSSHDGKGTKDLIEIVKSIQASFEQMQLPDRMRGLLK